MSEPVGCGRVSGAVSSEGPPPAPGPDTERKKEVLVTARVGQKAPEFAAPSYYRGGFTPVKLADFAGKWVLLCFYPGDFTFV